MSKPFTLKNLFPLFVLLFLLTDKLLAGGIHVPNQTVTYNKCNGTFIITFQTYRDDGCDDEDDLGDMDVKYLNTSGGWSRLYYYNKNNGTVLTANGLNYEHREYWSGVDIIREVKIFNRPADMATPADFKMNFVWYARSCEGDWTQTDSKDFDPISYQTIDAPNNLNATNNNCNEVTLNWSIPTQIWQGPANCGNNGTYQHLIYKNGEHIATVDATTNTYTVNNLNHGASDIYAVRTRWTPNGNPYFSILSGYSANATGSTKPVFAPPTFTYVSDDRCDGKIMLNWDYAGGEAPASFYIEYGINPDDNTNYIDGIAPSTRSYLFNPGTTNHNKQYNFKIKNINSCGAHSPYSSTMQGLAEGNIIPTTDVSATFDIQAQHIKVSWRNPTVNSFPTRNFKITRIEAGKSNVDYEISKAEALNNYNATTGLFSFIDENISNCVTYRYQVRPISACATSGVYNSTTSQSAPLSISQNITASMATFKASKGYYSDRVSLTWSTDQQVALTAYEIWRKIAGPNVDSIKIATVQGGTEEFTDLTAVAGFLYQYTIRGKLNCVGLTPDYTNAITDIGFKSPSGSVSGRVTYTGGYSSYNTKVTVERNNSGLSSPDGYSMSLNGTNQKIVVPHSSTLNLTNDFTVEFWVKPNTLNTNFTLINKGNPSVAAGGLKLYYTTSNKRLTATVNINGIAHTIYVDTAFSNAGVYHQVGVTRANDSLYLSINGEVKKYNVVPTGQLNFSNDSLIIGSAGNGDYFNGFIDDFRIWSYSKDTNALRKDFGRIVSPASNGLVLYFPFDENITGHSKVYDQAFDYNSQQPRENHGFIRGGANWSNNVPGSSNLAYVDYTDVNGYYTVSNIRYTGSGETFRVVPAYETHRFGPALRNLFLGESSSIHNGIDFTDSSSFVFKGRVLYGESDTNTNLMYNPSPNVTVYIDGNIAVQNMVPVTSNAQGEFEIRVPIGEHTITVKKDNHLFLKNGNWPGPNERYNFQRDINERAFFIDTTKIKLTGRIVGGPIEFNKPYGINSQKSKNNLGRAVITLRSDAAKSKNYESVYTDAQTGTYEVRVYPLFYSFSAAIVNNNQNITLGPYPNLNLTTSNAFDSVKFYDTSYYQGINCNPCKYLSDSSWYNKIYPTTTYRATPKLFISKKSNPKKDWFMGDDSVRVGTNKQIGVLAADSSFNFHYPLFQNGRLYSLYLYGYEEYRNHDIVNNPVISYVPYQGFVQINNNLKETNSVEQIELDSAGKYTYRFICGPPNISLTKDDTLSFTKSFQATLFPDKSYNYGTNWKNGGQRAIIIGNAPKSGGLDFYTVGPTNIDFIVRRPPGSSSVASVAKSSSYSRQTSFAKLHQDDTYLGIVKNIGATIIMTNPVAIGGPLYINSASSSTAIEAGINQTANLKKGDYDLKTYTTNFEIQTQPISGLAADLAGTGDVYVGRSNNYRFSEIYEVKLTTTPSCRNNPNVNCPLSDSADNYSIARVSTMGYDNAGINTSFVYSEYEIINNVIPLLERRRNELFATDTAKYKSKLPPENAMYGSNNDDLLWGNVRTVTNRITTEAADTTGPSYTCSTRGKHQDSTYASWDEIRNYNQEIRLWKEAIAKNEELKYKININRNAYKAIDNISFDSRSRYSKSYTLDDSKTEYQEWEVMASFVGNIEKEELMSGVGMGFKGSTTQGGGQAQDTSSTNSNSISWSYTFEDNDLNDRFSIDVFDPKDGGSPIFINKGGRSRCPNEGPTRSRYYSPTVDFISSHTNNSNALLSDGTIKIEAPKIEVIGANLKENIPANNPASFTIRLKNDANYELDYELKVDESTNPDGAVIKIDGLDPNKTYNIDSQGVITKVVTIERGPEKYIYDNIKLVFKSPCQDDIADEVYLTARFTPTCTDVNLKEPTNNWVVNTNSNNLLPVVLENYDINFSYFNNLSLHYKSKSSDTWIPLQWFNKNAMIGTENYIPRDRATIGYSWDSLNMLPDGTYEIKAVSSCWLDSVGFNVIKVNSLAKEGILDLTRPKVFGTPSPGDGILSPNDDISIQFTEEIDNSALRFDNFQVKGIPNTAPIRHNATLYFDGNNDRAEIGTAPNLAQKSFTISFWALVKKQNQKQVFISQGTNNNIIEIGLNNANKFYATIGNSVVTADKVKSKNGKSLSPAFGDTTELNFFAVSYNAETETIILFINDEKVNLDTSFTTNYTSSGKINIACDVNYTNAFKGNFTDLRFWSKALTITELSMSANSRTSISNGGILHNWELNEGTDSVLIDKIRKRELSVIGASWSLFNTGYALKSTALGDGVLSVNSGTYPITKNMDMTLEFWFKTSNNNTQQVLVSTGNPEFNNPMGYHEPYWQIKMLPAGQVQVGYRGLTSDSMLVNNTAYNDDLWHHFAMVLSRTSNLTTFIDGKQQNTMLATNIPTFVSSKITLCGVKQAQSPANNTAINYNRFIGYMDEFRLWDLARTSEQINADKNTRLLGKELGLKCYLPFEKYKNNAGVQLIDSTLENIIDSSNAQLIPSNIGLTITTTTPVIKLNEPYTNFDLTYLTNNDKIIIIPEASAAAIENVTLNVTASGIQDRYGNKLASPKTWVAYIDKNQVKWDNKEFSFEKKAGLSLSFTNEIINSGGETKQWSIGNLPTWLTASPASGTISPNSSKLITFTIDPTVNIGKYEIDLQLITNFGYYDKMYMKLKVYALPPASWSVNPDLYANNMNVIAQLKIDNTFSTNTDDMLAVFKDNVCRGTAKLQYYPQIDKYIAYLSVLSNSETPENLTYKIWNATEGKIHSLVEASDSSCLVYQPNAIKGNFITPVIFNATDKLTREIILNSGWNWISFNLIMPNHHINSFGGMNGVLSTLKQPSNGDLIRLQGIFSDSTISVQKFAEYSLFSGWAGELNKVDVINGYRFKSLNRDTITLIGSEVDPILNPIRILPGWNWIGFPSQRNLNIADALGNYTAQNGDILKSQTQFSMYVSNIGWVGTLNVLMPSKSYMLYSSNSTKTAFNYPRSAMFGKKETKETPELNYQSLGLNPNEYSMNAGVVATIDFCDALKNTNRFVLCAFSNNELRGLTEIYNQAGKSYFYLTLFGNTANEEYSLYLLDKITNKKYHLANTIKFKSNEVSGSFANPIQLKATDELDCQSVAQTTEIIHVYPSPFSDNINIEIENSIETIYSVVLYDIQGRSIMNMKSPVITGTNTLKMETENLSSGVYIIEVKSPQSVFTKKLIK